MTTIVRGATLIDGTGRDPSAATVVIEASRIAGISSGDGPRGATVVDASGLVLLPGLIDAHTHLGIVNASEPARMPVAVTAAHIFKNCDLALSAGFTTCRDVAGVDGALAQAIEMGIVRGPRLFPSGPMLIQSGGHGDLTPPFLDDFHHRTFARGTPGLSEIVLVCDGPDEVRRGARTAFRRGATQIKVCVSGGVVSLTDRMEDAQLSVSELRAAVEEAEARNTYVTAHAHSIPGMLNGLEAGIRTFEHGTFLDEPTAARLAAAGARIVPTLSVLHVMIDQWREWGVPEEALPRIAVAQAGMRNAIKLAIDAGISVGSGSDLLGPNQNRRGLEIALKAEVMGAMGAISSATLTNAQIMGIEDRLGTIEEGKIADLIGVRGDPLSDPSVLDDPDRVVLVIKEGVVVKDTRA